MDIDEYIQTLSLMETCIVVLKSAIGMFNISPYSVQDVFWEYLSKVVQGLVRKKSFAGRNCVKKPEGKR